MIANGIVYIGSQDHSFYALDANSGRKVWSYLTGGPIISTPAVASGVVYFGSLDNSMSIANGLVYFGSDDHSFYSLNAQTGSKLWSYSTGGNIVSSPAIANGMVYIGSDDNILYAFKLPTAMIGNGEPIT